MMDFDKEQVFESFEQEFKKKKKRKPRDPRFPIWAILGIFAFAAAVIIFGKNNRGSDIVTQTSQPQNIQTEVVGSLPEGVTETLMPSEQVITVDLTEVVPTSTKSVEDENPSQQNQEEMALTGQANTESVQSGSDFVLDIDPQITAAVVNDSNMLDDFSDVNTEDSQTVSNVVETSQTISEDMKETDTETATVEVETPLISSPDTSANYDFVTITPPSESVSQFSMEGTSVSDFVTITPPSESVSQFSMEGTSASDFVTITPPSESVSQFSIEGTPALEENGWSPETVSDQFIVQTASEYSSDVIPVSQDSPAETILATAVLTTENDEPQELDQSVQIIPQITYVAASTALPLQKTVIPVQVIQSDEDNQSEQKAIPALRTTSQYSETRQVPTDSIPARFDTMPEKDLSVTSDISATTDTGKLSEQTVNMETADSVSSDILATQDTGRISEQTGNMETADSVSSDILATQDTGKISEQTVNMATADLVSSDILTAQGTGELSEQTVNMETADSVSSDILAAQSTGELSEQTVNMATTDSLSIDISATSETEDLFAQPEIVATTFNGNEITPIVTIETEVSDRPDEKEDNWFISLFNRIFNINSESGEQTSAGIPTHESVMPIPPTEESPFSDASQKQTAEPQSNVTNSVAAVEVQSTAELQSTGEKNIGKSSEETYLSSNLTVAKSLATQTPQSQEKNEAVDYVENDNPLWMPEDEVTDAEETNATVTIMIKTTEPDISQTEENSGVEQAPELSLRISNERTDSETDDAAVPGDDKIEDNDAISEDEPAIVIISTQQPQELPETGFAQDFDLPLMLGILLVLLTVIFISRRLRHR